MIENKKRALLFIEPKKPKEEIPVVDELTQKIEELFKQEILPHGVFMNGKFSRGLSTLGIHTCICGARSESRDYEISSGVFTNTLATHYLRWHRDEVPEEELKKVRKLL